MSEVQRSLELLLQCQVCFEEFEEVGDHVPRLLPCTHTLCHTCIGQLIQGTKIECPECRKKHEMTNKEKSFPQNKYLLANLKRKSSQQNTTPYEFQKCKEHGKELNMFCRDLECNRLICRTCLKKEHKKHDFTEIEDQEKDLLMQDVVKIKVNFEAKLKIISTAKKDITNKTKAVIAELMKTKEEINLHIDKMIKESEEQNSLGNMHIDNEVSAINSNFDLLSSIQQNIESEEDMNYEEIMNNRETLIGISEYNDKNLSGVRSFGYPVLVMDRSLVEGILGIIKTDEVTIILPEPENPIHTKISETPATKIINASQLKCSGILSCFYFVLSLDRLLVNTHQQYSEFLCVIY